MKKIKIVSLFTALLIAFSVLSGCDNKSNSSEIKMTDSTSQTTESKSIVAPKKEQTMRDIKTMDIVREMGVGINLGNTFEAVIEGYQAEVPSSYEVAWGSPYISREIIEGYAKSGFGVLRIPVAWSNMMDKDYTINQLYIDRVKEVTEWALNSGMYVIVNIHWDGGWWEDFPKNKAELMKKYERIWTQLATAFNEYGDFLILESLNEEGGWEKVWNRYSKTGDKAASYGLLNEINQKFVDIIRSSGGNNEKRHLLIAGYNTDFELTSDEMFKMPKDEQNSCAVSVHYYTPPTFCILEKDESWGKAKTQWGNEKDIEELNKYFDMVKKRFIDNGVPVIVGEYGVATKNKTAEMVRKYLTAVTEAAYSRGMCPVLWDIPGLFYDRYNFQMKDEILLKQMLDVINK